MKVGNGANSPIQNNAQGLQTKKAGANGVDGRLKNSAAADASQLASLKADSARVDMSPRAQEFNKIKNIAKNSPDIDEAKVKRFQDLIDRGMYKMDASAIADKLVDEQVKNLVAENSEE